MANTPKELRKVVKTGVARVKAAAAGKDPNTVSGMKEYRKVSNSTSKKALGYDMSLMKGQGKQIAKQTKKETKRTGPASGFMAKAKKK